MTPERWGEVKRVLAENFVVNGSNLELDKHHLKLFSRYNLLFHQRILEVLKQLTVFESMSTEFFAINSVSNYKLGKFLLKPMQGSF